jgi:hypothetical protein
MRAGEQRSLTSVISGPSVAVTTLVSQDEARVPTVLAHNDVIDHDDQAALRVAH